MATAGTGPSASSSAAADPPRLATLPERFVGLDDVVAQELADLDQPWDIKAIEDRIGEYTKFSEAINAQLSARVMQNYNEFVQGMQQVQSVETELTLIGVLVKNGRRKLQERDQGIVRGSMQVTRQHKKGQRIKKLLDTLKDFQEVAQIETKLREALASENFCEAIIQHQKLREALATDRFNHFPGMLSLREGLSLHLAEVQQKLSDGLRVAAVSAEFDAERYEEILKAYSMMSGDQALSVGKELLLHVSNIIVETSRQCMLMFSGNPGGESPADWHRKAQLRDLCRSMDPTHFVECAAKLYEHLCDFLYRHQFLCQWHVSRAEAADGEDGMTAGFKEVLRDVQTELLSSKRNVWDRIQQQVSLVLMTLEFQYPGLSEDSFLHILHLTQLLIEEGDAFMTEYQPTRSASGGGMEGRRKWSDPIRNTLKSKAHDYFQSLHYNAWVTFKTAYIEQDSWQRLPVARSYSLIRKERLQAAPLRRDGAAGSSASAAATDGSAPRPRSAESNPFRNYKPEPIAPASLPEEEGDGRASLSALGDEVDEHALLQHWIDGNETLPADQIGSSMLSNSNRSPVVSSSTVELARVLERYFRMMGAMPQLAEDIFQSAIQLIEFYVHCVVCLFVQDRHLRVLLEELDMSPPLSEVKLQLRHEALLLHKLCPDLRRAVVRIRDSMMSLPLPDSCAAGLNVQPPVTGALLMQLNPFPKLTSPACLCGLSERCVGVESVGTLLSDLQDLQKWLAGLLPKGDPEAAERSFSGLSLVQQQLRVFVLKCAASDVLEVPSVGRVSLDHFSNTVQALRWDAKDFSQGSPAAPYLEQLRNQIDELARRVPCCGGGSIPYATQLTVWGWMEVRLIHESVEVVAKCGRKKSPEALVCMREDFNKLRNGVRQNFRAAGGAETEDPQLLPADHMLAPAMQWGYVDQYLEAHSLNPSEVIVWCKRHPEVPLRLHKALVDYLHGSQKTLKQYLGDLESYFAGYIADEGANFSQRGY